ncbi:hypothetical protein BHE90_016786 [Fusarium euwallaceae]|uniref:Uncharacterized protein n=2 Tax=Fusarium solani species complex TaxID=232080 RepID=A0A430KZG1_9HYPO|nr:hypothetical protein CEP51_015634 [Fusarium floridanum]RTE68836.1 hypothetical protein BHE90_016786 [Fusarium euwallaceae]
MPLRMRKVSYRSSTRNNNDTRDDDARDNNTRDHPDDDTRDDQVPDNDDRDNARDNTIDALDDSIHNANSNRASDETIFEVCPHPPSDYRVVRFTVGLVNTNGAGQHMLAGQPIELCFHDDFEASPRRPLSLHFDRTYLTYYGLPPVLEAPPPPGVIIELGRVDVLPDDPQFLAMLEGQIRLEIDEDTEGIRRDHRATRRHRLDQLWAWGGLLSLVICLLSTALGVQRSTPPSPPVTMLPLIEHLTDITFSTTALSPTVFFNQHRYPAIGDSSHSDMPIDKTSTLELSWKLTRWLTNRIQKPISWKAWHLYQSTSQDEDASRRFFNRSLWEYRGVQFDETERLKEKVNLLTHRAENLWESIGEDIFNWWVRIQIASIGRVASNVAKLIELSPEDNMFMAQDNASLSWIPAKSLPKQIPHGIYDILDSYRTLFLQNDHLSNSCQVFRDCTEPIPTSAPPSQAVHPGCFFLADTDINSTVGRMMAWAASARGRNLTWEVPHSMASRSNIFTPNHVHDHFWPNRTDFPSLFDQVMILAQLKDTVEQALEMAETVDDAWAKDKVTHAKEMTEWAREMMPKDKVFSTKNQTFWGKWKSRLAFKKVGDVHDGEKMKQLRELVQVHISRQLWDTVEGLSSLRIICQQMNALSTLVEDLYTPESWILNKNETSGHVQLWKLPYPKEHALAIRSLQTELLRRHMIMQQHQKKHEELEKVGRLRRENEKEKEGMKKEGTDM